MAQSYVKPKPLRSSLITNPVSTPQERPLSALELGDSVYVFPNPSSLLPSPSQASDFSTPTDFTFSGPSEPRSRDSSARRSSILTLSSAGILTSSLSISTPSSGEADGAEQWEWMDSVMNESTLPFDDGTDRPDRWEILVRRRARDAQSIQLRHLRSESSTAITRKSHRRVQSTSSSSGTSAATPHPRIQIPLLAFFISLLSVNDSTLHLVSHTSSHSVLFPGHMLSNDVSVDDEAEQLHGIARLLMPSNESQILRDGCAVASDPSLTPSNPFLISPFRFAGLLGLVSDFMANGSKALREVMHS